MRRSVVVGFAVVAFAWTCGPLAAWADDQLIPGKFTMITQGGEAKFKAEPDSGTFDLPDGDPRIDGAVLEIFDTGGGAGSDVYQLPAENWAKIPAGRPKKILGYIYHGVGDATDPCTLVILLPHSVKPNCGGVGVTLAPPFAGQVGIILTIGETRFCMSFGGTTFRDDERRTHRRNAPPPAACPASGGGTTTCSY